MNKIAKIIDETTAILAHDNREAERQKVVVAARETRRKLFTPTRRALGHDAWAHTLSCGCTFNELSYSRWTVECDRHRRPVLIHRIPAGVDVTDGGRYTAD